MRRAIIIGAIVATAGMAGAGALFGRDFLVHHLFAGTMDHYAELSQADTGSWSQAAQQALGDLAKRM